MRGSERYDRLFRRGEHYVSFSTDLSDFAEILESSLGNEGARCAISQRAYEHVRAFHTWERRIRELTALVAHTTVTLEYGEEHGVENGFTRAQINIRTEEELYNASDLRAFGQWVTDASQLDYMMPFP